MKDFDVLDETINESVLREGDNEEIAYELEEIKEQIKGLVYEAFELIPRDGMYASRARSYWYAHILTALDDESEFMGGSMHSMQDTIDEIRSGDEDDDEFGDEAHEREVRGFSGE